MNLIPEWISREGRPLRDLNSKEWDHYREEMVQARYECLPIDDSNRLLWVWRQGVTAGSRVLTPVFVAAQHAAMQYPGCQVGLHPDLGMLIFWNDRLFIWPAATPEEVGLDAALGPFFDFGDEAAPDDRRLVVVHPTDTRHQTLGQLRRESDAMGFFPPRTDGKYAWFLRTTPTVTKVDRYPLADPPSAS